MRVLSCFQIDFGGPNIFSFFSLFLENKKPLSLRKFCYKYTTQVSLWSVLKRFQLTNYPPSRKILSYCQGIPLWAYYNTKKEKKLWVIFVRITCELYLEKSYKIDIWNLAGGPKISPFTLIFPMITFSKEHLKLMSPMREILSELISFFQSSRQAFFSLRERARERCVRI